MKQRIIAAVMVASLLLGSVPAVWASVHLVGMPMAAHHTPAPTRDHSCCPGLHPKIAIPILVNIAPGPMPCGSDQPCCAKPGPQNPPTLPASGKPSRSDSQAILVGTDAGLARLGHGQTILSSIPPPHLLPLRSAVLRI